MFNYIVALILVFNLMQDPIKIRDKSFNDKETLRTYIITPINKKPGYGTYKERLDKTEALKYYSTLNYEDAKQIAIEEMKKILPEFDSNGLLFIKDEELPELTKYFRENMKCSEYAWHLTCVERYGSKDLLPDVLEVYLAHKGVWACSIADACLSFIIKHDRNLGLQLIEEAVTLRKDTGCYKSVLLDVLKKYPGSDLTTIASKYIFDTNEDVAMNAVTLISQQEKGVFWLEQFAYDNSTKLSKKVLSHIKQIINYHNITK